MSKLSIDTDTLHGKLVVALINPDKANLIANLGVSIAKFLGREIPSRILAQDLIILLELVAEVPGPGTSGDQNAGIGKSEDCGTPPIQSPRLGPNDG